MKTKGYTPITDTEFWSILELVDREYLERDHHRALKPLVEMLLELNVHQMIEFKDCLHKALFKLDTPEHAKQNRGDDDAFLFARLYIIARGIGFYQAVLADPSKMPGSEKGCEWLLYLVDHTFEVTANQLFQRSHKYSYVSHATPQRRAL